MANVTRENIALLNDKITVTVQSADYLPAFEKALKGYGKNANLPGFRKGMVPAGLVKKMYGQSVFTDEVLRTVDRELGAYLDKEQLNIFAQPVPTDAAAARNLDMNSPADYSFSFEVGLKPDFSTASLETANLTRYKVTVTDEMVNNEAERLQQRHGNMTEPETVTTEENVLNVTFKACDADGNEVEGGLSKDNSLLVKYFTENFRPQLMTAKKDDSFVLQLNKVFEQKEREWVLEDLGFAKTDAEAGDRHFKMIITKLGLIEKREMNEEFFNQVYPDKAIATEAEFKANLKEEIEKYWDAQSRNQLQDAIYHHLVDHTSMDLPEGFLKKWMMTGRDKPSTAEEVEKEYPSFNTGLKWTLISDKLIQENQLSANPEDIKEFARRQVMTYMGVQALDESHSWVEEYANKMMKDRKYVEESYQRIVTEKLFHWAEGKVSTTEKAIEMEAFAQMQQEHQHHHHQ
jgi:trigger factor